jgi:antitoxin MazE
MTITQSLQKWGNGTGVRLPKKVVEAAQLKINQPLEVTIKDKSVILTPIDDSSVTIDSLLQGVTPDKINGELDWGEDTGAEKYE